MYITYLKPELESYILQYIIIITICLEAKARYRSASLSQEIQ
jgi:hypothetical protein